MGGVEISLGPAGRSIGGPEAQQGKEKPEVIEAVEPEEQPEPQPQPTEPIDPIKPTVEPEPTPEPVQEVQLEALKQITSVPEPVALPAPTPQATLAGNAGKSGTTTFDDKGSGDNTTGGGLAGDTENYAATLLAWLGQHKEYPRRARVRKQQGTALLYIEINRQGEVLNYRIHQSSGYKMLDKETLAMLKRAQPLPAMPASITGETMELIAPVEFFLR
ncbi:MAG: energy transducer TonB [Pseudomonadota bacterium]